MSKTKSQRKAKGSKSHSRSTSTQSSKSTLLAPTQISLPYLTRFKVTLPPVLPFGKRHDYEGKLHSFQRAFGNLYCHLSSCDPTATLIHYHSKKPTSPIQEQVPPIGPTSPLKDFPNSLYRMRHYLAGFDPLPRTGKRTQCYILLRHMVEPTLLEKRLTTHDKYFRQFYYFDVCWSQHQPVKKQHPILASPLFQPIIRSKDQAPTQVRKKKGTRKKKGVTACYSYLPKAAITLPPMSRLVKASPVAKPVGNPPPVTREADKPLPPMTNPVEPSPAATAERKPPPVARPSRLHSATTRTQWGLRWLLAVLERRATTAWDLVFTSRFWRMTWAK